MTTHNTHSEHNDVQENVVQPQPVSENPETSAPVEVSTPASEETGSASTNETEEKPVLESASPAASEQSAAQAEPATEASASPEGRDGELSPEQPIIETAPPVEDVMAPLTQEEIVRPFTDFLEEFRQAEEQFSTLIQEESSAPFAPLALNEEIIVSEPEVAEQTGEEPAPSVAAEQAATPEAAAPVEETSAEKSAVKITPPVERPVSPLLRPATRIRLPRHARHREEPVRQPQFEKSAQAPEAAKSGEPPRHMSELVVPPPAVAEPPAPQQEEPQRPARRYRFDRPAPAASSAVSPAPAPHTTPPSRVEESKPSTFARGESGEREVSVSPNTTKQAGSQAPVVEQAGAKQPDTVVSEAATLPSVGESNGAPATTHERKRRNSHERTREKEQKEQPAPAPVSEVVAPEPEPLPAAAGETPVEDLPPLEYSELQAASSRRRRRRRTGTVGTSTTSSASARNNGAESQPVAPPATPAPVSPQRNLVVPGPASVTTPPAAAQNYNIVSGYTVNQMNQGNDNSGPFMGPEPSPARGSALTRDVRPVRGDAARHGVQAYPQRDGHAAPLSSASVNYLGNVISQAIQTQTDRMVAELRRANQVPANISVSLPPFPSNERVGVFVDVANLLYSARTLRMTIDFGKLLDFLRGNRRLVRAHAYCPTSPQPGDDQMFLQAVKGLGYRITTKNYKTFSSGAKKADLDLDLCMDVVRLVDGNSVDCIVLVSGDSDFMPMLDYCSDHGVRVEVAAFDESMSATLRQGCDLFVNLSMLEEIRA